MTKKLDVFIKKLFEFKEREVNKRNGKTPCLS